MRARGVHSQKDGLVVDRQIHPLGPELVRMTQRYRVPRRYGGHLVTGAQWLFSLVWVRSGSARFVLAPGQAVEPPAFFGMLLPAFTIVHFDWRRAVVDSEGFLSTLRLSTSFGRRAMLFALPEAKPPTSFEELDALLARHGPPEPISAWLPRTSTSAQVKRLIDREHQRGITLAEVSRRLDVARGTITRCFQRDLAIGPLEYRHRLQLMSAMLKLTAGEGIADAAHGSGYQDLGTFYRRFHSLVRATPAQYRT
jgi:AraC-like DNA-binding protein